VHKILVDVVEGGGGGGQEHVAKLGFCFLLPMSPSIKKHFFIIMSIETKYEHFCALFCLFVKREVTFS
jgi:hypothetical protein